MRLIFKIMVLVVAASMFGCDTDDRFDGQLGIDTIIKLEQGLVVKQGDPGRLLFLQVEIDGIGVRELFKVPKEREILYMVAGPDADAPQYLYMLTVPRDERETDVNETFSRLDPLTGERIDYEVGTAFGGITFGPDGEYAVLYHDGSGQEGLYNPSEVAILNIDNAPSENNPRVLSVDIGGRTIDSVAFVDPMDVQGANRHLLLFMAQGLVKMVDIDDPSMGTVSVKLVTDDDPRTVIPRQVVARPGDGVRDPIVFVRASGSQDIYAISLVERPDGQPGFWASLNQFEGGVQPADLEVVEDDDKLLLLVSNDYGYELRVIDVDTADTFSISLQDNASQMFSRDRDGSPEVAMYGYGTGRVYLLTIEGLAQEKGSNLDDLLIPGGMGDVSVLDDDRLVADSWSTDGMVVVDLANLEVTKLSSASGYSISGATLYDDVFFIADSGDDRVMSLDLATGHPEPLVLDERVDRFDVFSSVGMGMVVHPTVTGRMTLFPLATPYREYAFVVDGVWIGGFLDGKEVTQ